MMLARVGIASVKRLLLLSTIQTLGVACPPSLEFFTFPELVNLSSQSEPEPALKRKLETVLNTLVEEPLAEQSGVKPARPVVQPLGPVLRALFWNIERGQNFELIRLALTDPEGFQNEASKNGSNTPAVLETIRKQAALARDADLLVFNEVDLGMKRSGYRDVARELAQALKMNFVFAVEFVELDPLMLGIEKVALDDPELAERLQKELQADPDRLRALHGSAILSRYPIRKARIFRLPPCHDWFADEKQSVPGIEKAKRFGSEKVFLEEISTERRRGGRMGILADIEIPDLPGGAATILNLHLETKCKPECRKSQMNFALDQIKGIRNPVIITGDLNTSGSDGNILSLPYILEKKVTDYRFWGKQLVNFANPINFFGTTAAAKYYRNYTDPTVKDIPVFANNREHALFKSVRHFRFADNGAFDFGGQKNRSSNGSGKTLSNSNERDAKGFVYTYALPRDFKGAVGRFKLDWFFIKPAGAEKTGNHDHPSVFSPYFGRTLRALNEGPEERVSDHSPLIVDLPLALGSGH
jgi:endonuclease/exonuclease/phosphatase family metal-dependent hydrolase